MDKFLETYSLPKLNKEESEIMNRQILPSEIEAIIKKKNSPNKQKPWTGWLHSCSLQQILRTNTSPYQTTSQNLRGGRTPKLIL